MKTKALSTPDVTVVSEDLRILRFKISDETKDRYGDRVMVKGWKFDNYQKNPVLLFGHDYRQPAIGKAVKTYVQGDSVFAEFKFASAEVYPFADTIYKLMKPPESYMRAVSVGFDPDEAKIRRPQSEEEREEMGLGRNGVMFEGQDLLEVSVVPVPANPNAVMDSVERGIINSDEAEWLERAFGQFFDDLSRYGNKNLRTTPCVDSGISSSILSLQQEIRILAEKVEKLGKGSDGRPADAAAQASKAEQALGADYWEKLLDHAESMAKELKQIRTQV